MRCLGNSLFNMFYQAVGSSVLSAVPSCGKISRQGLQENLIILVGKKTLAALSGLDTLEAGAEGEDEN